MSNIITQLSGQAGTYVYSVFSPKLTYSVQFSRSVVSDSLRPHDSQQARPPCPSPAPGVHTRLTSIDSVIPSSHLILCRPLLLLPPIPPSIRVFSNESTLHMRFSIIPSKEIPPVHSEGDQPWDFFGRNNTKAETPVLWPPHAKC